MLLLVSSSRPQRAGREDAVRVALDGLEQADEVAGSPPRTKYPSPRQSPSGGHHRVPVRGGPAGRLAERERAMRPGRGGVPQADRLPDMIAAVAPPPTVPHGAARARHLPMKVTTATVSPGPSQDQGCETPQLLHARDRESLWWWGAAGQLRSADAATGAHGVKVAMTGAWSDAGASLRAPGSAVREGSGWSVNARTLAAVWTRAAETRTWSISSGRPLLMRL